MGLPTPTAVTLSTTGVPKRERLGWLREVIAREYVKVEISPPSEGNLFSEMTIPPWENLRLPVIRSSAIAIERLAGEPYQASQDAYFAVILLSGRYALEQQGREVFLKPGDITFYDATRPHRIHCPGRFSKLIVSIPRMTLRERIAGMEHCTARPISGRQGIGAVASGVGLSSRYVNELFQAEGTSLMRHVWQRRLEQCRRDLMDPVRSGCSLSEIAFRWGFNDLSHFSRAFKLRFGCSPNGYRRQYRQLG
ncbi:helix-turn-helix domain-containing protein [Methylococcus mesophilus]|uniref:helix-turn-helix domain-containing protein n=1 Tax=Methylococcus mesophilus TaxID=2993564 RepID=UPI00224A71D4|nr:helix-turn-helix domain-containing protein [Methylococcus mesophilus]UZR27763.1 helix-turn-helix domain-containing protein [Methylococcus mesophilus]